MPFSIVDCFEYLFNNNWSVFGSQQPKSKKKHFSQIKFLKELRAILFWRVSRVICPCLYYALDRLSAMTNYQIYYTSCSIYMCKYTSLFLFDHLSHFKQIFTQLYNEFLKPHLGFPNVYNSYYAWHMVNCNGCHGEVHFKWFPFIRILK